MEDQFKRITTTAILLILLVLAYFLLKPLLIPIILGVIIAAIFIPLNKKIQSATKNRTLSNTLTFLIMISIIIIPLWFLTPLIVEQSTKLLTNLKGLDLWAIFQNAFPDIQSKTVFKELIPTTSSFLNSSSEYFLNSLSTFLKNIPRVILQTIVFLFTFFFVLRDHEKIIYYTKSLMPFSKEVKEKIIDSSRGITKSIVYGRILMGLGQGIIVGIGFFIFGLENALILTILASFAGILPIVGTVIVWLPLSLFFFSLGQDATAMGIIFFGLLATFFESVIQPVFLAKMVKMNSSIMLIGMVGGLFVFGIIGVIIGPLILAYLLIILDIYRNKN